MVEFREFMNEEKLINRWTIFKAGLLGAFCGALLATGFYILVLAR